LALVFYQISSNSVNNGLLYVKNSIEIENNDRVSNDAFSVIALEKKIR